MHKWGLSGSWQSEVLENEFVNDKIQIYLVNS